MPNNDLRNVSCWDGLFLQSRIETEPCNNPFANSAFGLVMIRLPTPES
jgi:hypothetical protein